MSEMLSLEYLASPEWNGKIAQLISLEGKARAEALFDMFSAALRSDEMMLFHFRENVGPEVVEHRTSKSVRQQQINDYKNGFYLTDPFYLAIERSIENQAISLKDVVDQDDFQTSDFFVRHYVDTDLVDEMCYCMSDGQDGHILLSFARSRDAGRYSDEELELAKAIAPIVFGTLSSSWRHFADPKLFVPPSPEEVKLHDDLKRARDNFGRSLLTDREFEVVQMMLRGYPIDVIAKRLKMAEGTAKVHRRNIYAKLDISSMAELFSLFIDVVGEVNVGLDADPLLQYGQAPRSN